MPDLKGKVAIITGASSGIGEGTALHFASLGCWLSLTARNKQALERVAKECCAKGLPCDKVIVVPGDISVEKDVAAVVEKTAKHFGKIDILSDVRIKQRVVIEFLTTEGCAPINIHRRLTAVYGDACDDFSTLRRLFGPLCQVEKSDAWEFLYKLPTSITPSSHRLPCMTSSIEKPKDQGAAKAAAKTWLAPKSNMQVNNAGMPMQGTIDSTTTEDYNRVWDTNFRGPLCMIKNALPYLRKTKGSIVNVSSVASTIVVKGSTPYCMSKAALDHLTRCAALENAPFGVRVNTINPGVIKTTLALKPGANVDEYMEALDKMTGAAHALGRTGTADEVARCIAFLASDDASFVTGISMPVDGGMLLMSSLSHGTPWEENK